MVFKTPSPLCFGTELLMWEEYIAYVATLTTQKDQVEEMQQRKKAAVKEIEGIKWSDEILATRIQDCQENVGEIGDQ